MGVRPAAGAAALVCAGGPAKQMLKRHAGRIAVSGPWPQVRSLGLAGCIVINLIGAAMISVLSTLGGGAATRRGSAVLWGLVVVLVVLSLFEIAHV